MTRSLHVLELAGDTCIMYHGTDYYSAQKIVRSQRFEPSSHGLLGKGVYVSRVIRKAENYRRHHPNADRYSMMRTETLCSLSGFVVGSATPRTCCVCLRVSLFV